MSIEEYFKRDSNVSVSDFVALEEAKLTEWFQLAPMTLDQVRELLPNRTLLAQKVFRTAQTILWGDRIADEIFPEAKCFHRIVICKKPICNYLQRLLTAEKKLIRAFHPTKDTPEAKSATAFAVLKEFVPGIQGNSERFTNFVKANVIYDIRNAVLDEQMDILQIITYMRDDYICVALDKRALPLYWLGIRELQGAFYFSAFAKSFINTCMPHYDDTKVNYVYPGCGAPFFSFVTDKMMERSRVPYFFITAHDGTQRTLTTIEGTTDKTPRFLIPIVQATDIDVDLVAQMRIVFSALHVYVPSYSFRKAWEKINESAKRARTVQMCIACNMNVAKWYRKDLPGHVFCGAGCYYE